MAYHDSLFPPEISYGSKGGPAFKTTVVTLASGIERRNAEWVKVRAEYDVSHGIKDPEQMEALRHFFYARYGMAHSFKFLDHGDFEIFDQQVGTGDGVKRTFQAIKSYVDGIYTYEREITKLELGSVEPLTINDVPKVETASTGNANGYQINYQTGVITFNVAPPAGQIIRMPYARFYVHVRFDIDVLDPVHEFWLYQSWESIPLVEVKGAV